MRILAIETSCDETAISIVDGRGGTTRPVFTVPAHLVASQTAVHRPWGGVVPMLAKREHGKALVPLLLAALRKAKSPLRPSQQALLPKTRKKIEQVLAREPELAQDFLAHLADCAAPPVDLIAVTRGPGLEPALWVGLNFARTLSVLWNIPLLPVNHLAGHLYSPLVDKKTHFTFPLVGLIISGGHTELVLVRDWLQHKQIGATRDDAVGEAFDKVARLLDLPYPGGPEIARLAQKKIRDPRVILPRPMIASGDYDFSFSGLKTAVLYLVKKLSPLDARLQAAIAYEFQQAVIDVLLAKTLAAVKKYGVRMLVVGGGVSANQALKKALTQTLAAQTPMVKLSFPPPKLATDNATMIALAAYLEFSLHGLPRRPRLIADGNLPLTQSSKAG